MPITYPADRQEVINRINTDVQLELPQADPFIRNTAISAICIGYGGAVYDLNINQQNLQKELFPDTATGQYALIWGTMKNIVTNAATPAIGYISIIGNAGITIAAADIEVLSSSGLKYKATESVTIIEGIRNVSTIVRDGSIATVTTTDVHNLATTDTIITSGADQSEYNITTTITVIDDTHFSFPVSGTPITPATGTIIATATNAIAQVTCETSGINTNLLSGASLTFSSTLAGVNSIVHVMANGLVGGTNTETNINYRNRYLNAYRNPFSLFNDSSIISQMKSINYVQNVWVFDTTPDVGQVTCYFIVYDTGSGVIPSPSQVDEVKNKLLEIKPANTDPVDVIILAPTAIIVDFTFSMILPDSESMRTAIINSLKQALAEGAMRDDDR